MVPMTLEYLVRESYYWDWIMAFLVASCCVLFNRLAGRKEESCPTWKDKLQMSLIYLACLFANMFFIWLLMMAQEAWLIERWGIKL